MDILDEFRRSTEELSRQALEARTMVELMAELTPDSCTGSDDNNLVAASVDADGKLQSLHIDPDWAEEIDPSALGATVFQAIQAAYLEQMIQLSRALEKASPKEVTDEDVQEYVRGQQDQLESGLAFGPRLDPVDAAEQVLKLIDTPPVPPQETASVGTTGPVKVAVVGGRVQSVEINGGWASRRSSNMIARAVLAEAQANATTAPHSQDRQLQDLLFGLLSTMKHMSEGR